MMAAAQAQEFVVDVRNLHYAIGRHNVFTGLNLKVRRGAITALMGPSGTGKTTLLRLIMGELAPASGSVHVFGDEVATLDREHLYALRRRVGLLFQNGALLT